MKRLYKKFFNLLFLIPVKFDCLKTYIAEWYAIIRKSPLYKDIKWTKEQQMEFDDFWKTNYGKKISNRWHKLYQSMNGVYRVDYIPEILYTTKIENKLNDYAYCKVTSDKALLGHFFDNVIPNVRTPKTYIANSFGVFYNMNREIISEQEAARILSDVGAVVIKPTTDSSSGSNVKILDIHNGINVKDKKSVDEIFSEYKENFIIQEKIISNDELKRLNPTSINTLRVISYVLNSEVNVAPISLRIGSGGSAVDNIHAGGMVVSVDDSGNLGEFAYRLGYGDSDEKFHEHPDTKIVFGNYKLSFIEDLIGVAKRLHGMTANIGVISWDFTVDENGDFIVVEANLKGQSVWFPQMISGRPLFGEKTEEFLSMLKHR